MLDVIKIKYWSFIPRKGSGRRDTVPIRTDLAEAGDREGARRRPPQQGRADGAVRRAPARGDRADAQRRRRAARAARRRRRHLRRQPQHQLHQHLPGRLRVLRFRPGQALARRLPGQRGRLRCQGERGGRVRRDRDLHAGRDPSRVHARRLRPLAAAGQGGRARDPSARLLADGGSLHVRAIGQAAARGVRVPARERPRLDARHRRRGVCTTAFVSASRRTSCRSTAGSRSSRRHTPAVCARP